MSYQLTLGIWAVTLGGVCAVALLRGARDERIGAFTILIAWLLTVLVFKGRSEETQWQVLVIDVGVFGIFTWIAMRTRRWWPLVVAGLKLLGLLTHLANEVDTAVSGWAYQTAGIIWSYMALFTIGYAAWTAPRYAAVKDEPTDEAGATRR